MAMKNRKKEVPQPFAALTKDQRFAGTYEVLVPAEGRARPYRVPLQFETQEKAESWIHSPEGKDMIREILEDAKD
jgi:antibiotic biosynthesis monooxygenase (ABM) superfamily enzyme